MAGILKTNSIQLGDSATDSQNFQLRTNVNGTATLARGAAGNLGDILTVDATGKVILAGGSNELGVNQSWQNMTASRTLGITYTNNTGKPIMLAFSALLQPPALILGYVENTLIAMQQNAGSTAESRTSMSYIVPAGNQYSISVQFSTISEIAWVELR